MIKKIWILISLLTPLSLAQDNLVVTRKIAVIVDTGISDRVNKDYLCDGLSKDFTGYGLIDNNGHGTNIAGIVYKDINPNDACLTVLKVTNSGYDTTMGTIIKALDYALYLSPFLVNMSMDGSSPFAEEERLIKRLNALRTHFVSPAGNQHTNLSENCISYPACYSSASYFWVVAGPQKSSNYGGPVNAIMPGSNICGFDICRSGTSQSAANWSNYLLRNGK